MWALAFKSVRFEWVLLHWSVRRLSRRIGVAPACEGLLHLVVV